MVNVISTEDLAAAVESVGTDAKDDDAVRARIASFRADSNASMMGGWT
ncbi:hypothetical protein [Nocardia gipuzkoensis]